MRGTTLLDLLLAVALVAIMVAIAVPRVLYLVDAAAVRTESARLMAALDAARAAALRLGTNAELVLGTSSWQVVARRSLSDSVVAWHGAGGAAAGVQLSGAGAPIVFSPAGITVGVANRTITLSRGLASRRVVLSRLGRVT